MVQHICEECGKPHPVRQADLNRGWGRTCSKVCAARKRERRLDRNGFHGVPKALPRPGQGQDENWDEEMEGVEDGGWDAHKVWFGGGSND
jgi:hypothetical protein